MKTNEAKAVNNDLTVYFPIRWCLNGLETRNCKAAWLSKRGLKVTHGQFAGSKADLSNLVIEYFCNAH